MTRLLCAVLILFSQQVFALDRAVVLSNGAFDVDLLSIGQWLEADHLSMSLAQLQNSPRQFSSLSNKPVLQPRHSYWLRFRIINPSDNPMPMVLSLGQGPFQIFSAYTQSQGGPWLRLAGHEKETLLTGNRGMELLIAANANQWIYLRLGSPQTRTLHPRLSNIAQYTRSILTFEQVLGACMGMLLILFAAHLLALHSRPDDRHYTAIVMLLLCLTQLLLHLPFNQLSLNLNELLPHLPWAFTLLLLLISQQNPAAPLSLRSSKVALYILSLTLLTLLLLTMNLPYSWVVVIPFALYTLRKTLMHNIAQALAVLIVLTYIIWQQAYSIHPQSTPEMPLLLELLWPLLCVVLVSVNLLAQFFTRQQQKFAPHPQQLQEAELLSKLSHELRTPMNGVMGMAELLADTSLGATQRDYIDTIQSSSRDMLLLLNRIGDFAKLSQGRLQLEKRMVELSACVEEVTDKFRPVANAKGLELVVNMAENLPEQIEIDPVRLQTVLDNLLDNALSYTEFGEIELLISASDDIQPGLNFVVRDTGKGLSREELRRLLQKASNPLSASNGIGIPLSKQLVEFMGGSLFVESAPGKGSRFSVTLPYTVPAQHRAGSELEENILQGLSMLIVDDNSTLRTVIQRYARGWGMQADATYGGKEALAMLRTKCNLRKPYDIILIDQNMPFMDGLQLARKIREDSALNDGLLKIMLTGMGISAVAQDAQQAGIQQILSKPVSARLLKSTLAKHIRQRHLHSMQRLTSQPD
jgi:signal transduction histidine kinase/CheY-like chemotaxis protein